MILSRPVNPRATRTALITASVPELTRRTFSAEGTADTIISANRTSASVLAPNDVPRAAASVTAWTTRAGAWPKISGPQEQTWSM